MNQAQIAKIHEAVRAVLRKENLQVFGARGGLAVDLDAFHRLLETATTAVRKLAVSLPARQEIALCTAVCWLGPTHRPPPAEMLEELGAQVRKIGGPSDDLLVELAVAFGLGWKRPLVRGLAPGTVWLNAWDGAYAALLHLVKAHCTLVHQHWIAVGVRGYPTHAGGASLLQAALQDAQLIVAALTQPATAITLGTDEAFRITCTLAGTAWDVLSIDKKESWDNPVGARRTLRLLQSEPKALTRPDKPPLRWPSGGRLVVLSGECETRVDSPDTPANPKFLKLSPGQGCALFGPAEIELWGCRCGCEHCAAEHRLESWNPSAAGRLGTLCGFIERAVIGTRFLGRLPTNQFVRGMLAAVLACDGFNGGDASMRLRPFQVEYRLCNSCYPETDPALTGPARGYKPRKGLHKTWSYVGTTRCDNKHILPDWAYRGTAPLVGIDGDIHWWFERVERCTCPACGALYELTPSLLARGRRGISPSTDHGYGPTPSAEPCSAPLHRDARRVTRQRSAAGLEEFVWCPACRRRTSTPFEPTEAQGEIPRPQTATSNETSGARKSGSSGPETAAHPGNTLPPRPTWVYIARLGTVISLDDRGDDEDGERRPILRGIDAEHATPSFEDEQVAAEERAERGEED